MIASHHQNELVLKHWGAMEASVARQATHDGDVEPAFKKSGGGIGGGICVNRDFDLGELGVKLAQHGRQPMIAGVAFCADTNYTPRTAVQGTNLRLSIAKIFQNAAGTD